MAEYIFGFHSIEEMLSSGGSGGVLLYSKEKGRITHLIDLARDKNVPVKQVDDDELDRLCDRKKHKGILLMVERAPGGHRRDYRDAIEDIEKDNALVLLLDGITDPHNFGAILRSADQFAVDLVLTTSKRSARETETVASTSSGANVYVRQSIVPNLIHAIEELKKQGYWIYGAEMGGEAAPDLDLKGKVALVMGSEGKGIRRLIKENCDFLISIPTMGHVDSLNVSVAAGILLYEVRRQQRPVLSKMGKKAKK
ncbi:MAG: 23S rRNA (guanosine(2251)-2'-O)-methyltransferase RlmB [Spirochaetales bacterium]|nr:23S rRNA (guanosine(2251)-2'-O)-methyltransferase RlmB [Spirochaetales bacterium]